MEPVSDRISAASATWCIRSPRPLTKLASRMRRSTGLRVITSMRIGGPLRRSSRLRRAGPGRLGPAALAQYPAVPAALAQHPVVPATLEEHWLYSLVSLAGVGRVALVGRAAQLPLGRLRCRHPKAVLPAGFRKESGRVERRPAPKLTTMAAQVDAALIRQVQDALAHLYAPAYLQTHALAEHVVAVGARPGAAARGRQLRQLILESIRALRPSDGASADPRAWRAHRILELRHPEAAEPPAIPRELGLAQSPYYVEPTRAGAAGAPPPPAP